MTHVSGRQPLAAGAPRPRIVGIPSTNDEGVWNPRPALLRPAPPDRWYPLHQRCGGVEFATCAFAARTPGSLVGSACSAPRCWWDGWFRTPGSLVARPRREPPVMRRPRQSRRESGQSDLGFPSRTSLCSVRNLQSRRRSGEDDLGFRQRTSLRSVTPPRDSQRTGCPPSHGPYHDLGLVTYGRFSRKA